MIFYKFMDTSLKQLLLFPHFIYNLYYKLEIFNESF